MSKDKFYKLIMDYAALTGVEQPGKIIDGAPVNVGEVPFSLVYDQGQNPDEIFIYGDLGPLPEKQKLDDQRALLAMNLDFYVDYNACLAISPVNGNAIICLSARLATLSPQSLKSMLETASRIAKAWGKSAS